MSITVVPRFYCNIIHVYVHVYVDIRPYVIIVRDAGWELVFETPLILPPQAHGVAVGLVDVAEVTDGEIIVLYPAKILGIDGYLGAEGGHDSPAEPLSW